MLPVPPAAKPIAALVLAQAKVAGFRLEVKEIAPCVFPAQSDRFGKAPMVIGGNSVNVNWMVSGQDPIVELAITVYVTVWLVVELLISKSVMLVEF